MKINRLILVGVLTIAFAPMGARGYAEDPVLKDSGSDRGPSLKIANDRTRAAEWNGREDFVVHEWGTFTSFSGSDGVFLEFRPLADQVSDLPDFVRTRAMDASNQFLVKRLVRGKIRMETPVLYFYTNEIRKVSVKVDFPQGLLTEFFPPVKSFQPPFDQDAAFSIGEKLGNSSLDWGQVTLIPTRELIPNSGEDDSRNELVQMMEQKLIPPAGDDQHYVQARATDAALVYVRHEDAVLVPGQVVTKDYLEKFLFYRGVGKFDQPLTATFKTDGSAVTTSGSQFGPASMPLLTNKSDAVIPGAIMISVQGERLEASEPRLIAPSTSMEFAASHEISKEKLENVVVEMLVQQGLYRKEAVAMVKTWDASWFTEQGSRVLYIVPDAWTTSLLPLHVEPAPTQLVRVLVGRLELLPPSAEQTALEDLRKSAMIRGKLIQERQENNDNEPVHLPLPASIQRFGRMAEPVLVRVATIAKDENIRNEAAQLKWEHFELNK